MTLPIYIVDAFTKQLFSGNPAAICPLSEWLEEELMQRIAMENNLSETAFFVEANNQFEIRWFTPTAEVDLCGHATLAASFVIFNMLKFEGDTIHFHSHQSGVLKVTKAGDSMSMNFPADVIEEIPFNPAFDQCFNSTPAKVFKGKSDLMFVFDNESQIRNMDLDFKEVEQLGGRGVIVTAKGDEVDFVSRCFFPGVGVNEDPVTGSAHTTMIPYWSKVLHKKELTAQQISKRGGALLCEDQGDRVVIGGEATLYLVGEIHID